MGSIKRTESSDSILKRLQQLYPNSPVANNIIGIFQFQRRNKLEAQSSFTKAISEDPLYSSPKNNLGVSLIDDSDYGQALIQFDDAIASGDSFGIIDQNKGHLLEILGREEEAVESYARAARLNPENPICYTCWALTLYNIKRYDEAVRVIMSGFRIDPSNSSLYYVWSLINQKKNCWSDSISEINQALSLDDGRVKRSVLLHSLALSLLNSGQDRKARATFLDEARSYGIDPNSDESSPLNDDYATSTKETAEQKEAAKDRTRYALALAYSGEHEVSTRVFYSSMRHFVTPSDDQQASDELADWSDANLSSNKIQEALDAARQAVRKNAKNWNAHLALGRALVRNHMADLAVQEFEIAALLGGDTDIGLFTNLKFALSSMKAKFGSEFIQKQFHIPKDICLK